MEFVSIVDSTLEGLLLSAASQSPCGPLCVLLLGTLLTTNLQKSPYARLQELAAARGVEVTIPQLGQDIRDRLQKLINAVKSGSGPGCEKNRGEMWSILVTLLEGRPATATGATAVVL